jgi:single-stranded DNA-binding protein
MIYENSVKLTGIVICEPILNNISEKTKLANFILKTVNVWIDKDTKLKKVNVKRHKIICWDLVAEKAMRVCKLGNLVSINGEISYKIPQQEIDEQGNKIRPIMEIKATKVQAAILHKFPRDEETDSENSDNSEENI